MQKRNTSTKSDIKEALTQLLSQRRFDDISISQLTKKAGINRSTFYLHYLDKYDLLNQLKDETVADLTEILQRSITQPRQALVRALAYVREELGFFQAVQQSNATDFSSNFQDFVYAIVRQTPGAKQAIIQHFCVPEKYALELFLSSTEGVISRWIADGAPESPEELTDILLSIPSFQWWKQAEGE